MALPQELPGQSVLELVFPSPADGLPPSWQALPGAVLRQGPRGLALHFAPARWLLFDYDPAVVAVAVNAGATLIDVEGKWRMFELDGPQHAQALSAAANIAKVLDGRDCAALQLFDCPAVIARSAPVGGVLVCVPSSYALHFAGAFATALRRTS
jgi:hypothetical protein